MNIYEVVFFSREETMRIAFEVSAARLPVFLRDAKLCGLHNYVLLRKRKFTRA